jgi:predicted nuclease with TOPRIM domain
MPQLERIKSLHKIGLDISPNEADIAVVSTDSTGRIGQLNEYVLKAYGYSEKDLPSRKDIENVGFTSLTDKNKKPILFIVTVNNVNSTETNLSKNLLRTLSEYRGWFRGKKIWIPLMGTGTGRLSIERSYSITVNALNKFQKLYPTETTVVLSIPNSKEGILFKTQLDDTKSYNDNIEETNENFITNSRKETIAGLISDSEIGVDHLNISEDVNAFARVISARSFEPPLAIALFGKWGSGKSFFMRKLKEKIIDLSNNDTGKIYCSGISHIHFNAWSYIDSSLWASIVTKIFEGLNEYITENSRTIETKKEIEKELTNQLSITKEEIYTLKTRRKLLEDQINLLKNKQDEIKKNLKEKIQKVQKTTVWHSINNINTEFKAKEKIITALRNNTSYLNTENQLKELLPEQYWNNPEKSYEIIRSKLTFFKEFFNPKQVVCNLIWIGLILLVIILAPLFLESILTRINRASFLIPQAYLSLILTASVFLHRASVVYKGLQPIITSFWNIKEQYEKQIKEAVSKFEQEEKSLRLEIERDKSEVLIVSEQIQKLESVKAELEFKITNAFDTEVLYAFIDRRSKSDDYKKHLGIISTIRKDFEILNNLFVAHNQEIDSIRSVKEFQGKFKKPLERIILYIDDLDRCPSENVIQVLEAVNLLMAFPLFIVIVGVDPRWIKNSLLRKYNFQFTNNLENITDNNESETIDPIQYLEKIFQIPFHIKEAKDESIKDMIRNLANSNSATENSITVEEIKENFVDSSNIFHNKNNFSLINNNEYITSIIPESLTFSEKEISLMQDMSEVIGTNPRAIKRFVNVYRVIKAHEGFKYQDNLNEEEELVSILFLLALPLGEFRKLRFSFEKYIQRAENETKSITLYMQENYQIGDLDLLKHQLDVKLSGKESFSILQRTPAGIFNRHNSFIKRFTFG